MLQEMLKERRLPPLKSREEMLYILQKEQYGFVPPPPDAISFETEENLIKNFCAGHAVLNRVTVHCTLGERQFSFPFHAVMPAGGKKYPFFVNVNFRPDLPDLYVPAEEIVDHGFALLSLYYEDVTTDDGDMTNGLAGALPGQDAGKIALWAWAAQRMLDWAQTQTDALDMHCAVVCGHSRLGKTAMLAAATDERFTHCYSNDSGSSGAAIARGKTGETVEKICARFPYWFCPKFNEHRGKEHEMPFDQHYLAACIAPRKLLIGSASLDAWADPVSEMLCCVAASPAFEKGFVYEDRLPVPGDAFLQGDIGYHLREGTHYFSRQDWLRLIAFVQAHENG